MPHTLACETLTSENERLSTTNVAINDAHSSYVLGCGGIFNKKIKHCLFMSLPVKFFKSLNIWHSYGQKGGLSSVLILSWPGAQSARDNHLLAYNDAKYSPT